jgi:hypothetical protein
VIGSNIANLGLVLRISALIAPIQVNGGFRKSTTPSTAMQHLNGKADNTSAAVERPEDAGTCAKLAAENIHFAHTVNFPVLLVDCVWVHLHRRPFLTCIRDSVSSHFA